MTHRIQTIAVYCASSDGLNETYYEAARQMGTLLAHNGITLVYGAGKTGLMGAVANGALEAGGEVIGVIPQSSDAPALAHPGLTRLEFAANIQARKARMSELADAFIALPGGYGTFDELFETLAWAQIGIHAKAIGLLNLRGYFNPLIEMVENACREGFIYPEHRGLFCTAPSPAELFSALQCFESPSGLERWLNR